MFKPSLAAFVLVIGFSTTCFAQSLTAAQRTACKEDYDKYCAGVAPGDGRIVACLNKQRDSLGDGCEKSYRRSDEVDCPAAA